MNYNIKAVQNGFTISDYSHLDYADYRETTFIFSTWEDVINFLKDRPIVKYPTKVQE